MPDYIFDPDKQIPLATRRLFAADLIATEQKRQEIEKQGRIGIDGNFGVTSSTLNHVIEKYRGAQKTIWMHSLIADGADTLAQLGVAVLGVRSQLGRQVLRMGEHSTAEWVRNRLATDLQQEASRNLRHELQLWRQEQFAHFQEVYNTPPEKFLRDMWGSDPYQLLFGKPIGSHDPDGEKIIEDAQIQFLALKLSQNELNGFLQGDYQENEAKRTRADLATLRATQKTLQESLEEDVSDTKAAITDLRDEFQADRAGRDFTFQVMFNGMSAADKVQAINARLITTDEKTESQLRIAAKWESINASTAEAVDAAGKLLSIAKALGAPPEFVHDVSAVASAGKTIVAAIGKFAVGGAGILDGVAMVSQLFMSGEPDPAMAQLQKDIAGLYSAIEALSRQIETGFQAVLDEIDHLFDASLFNRSLELNGLILRPLASCATFLDRRVEKQFGYLPTEQRFPSYDTLAHHFHECSDSYLNGRTALQDLYGGRDKVAIDIAFLSESHVSSANKSRWQEYQNKVFEASLALARADANERNVDFDQYLSRFIYPMESTADIPSKFRPGWKWEAPPEAIPGKLESFISGSLEPYYVHLFADYLVEFDSYYDWVEDPLSGKLRSLAEMLEHQPDREFQDFLLHRALQIVDVAIAQQTILSGDVLLDFADRLHGFADAASGSGRKPVPGFGSGELHKQLLSVVEGNPLFAGNHLLYSFTQRLRLADGQPRALSYAYSLEHESSGPLNALLGDRWEFHKVTGEDKEEKAPGFAKLRSGWAIKVGGRFVNLPTPEEVFSQKLLFSQQMPMLLSTRANILNLLLDDRFPQQLSPEERTCLYRTIVSDIVGRKTIPGRWLDLPPQGSTN